MPAKKEKTTVTKVKESKAAAEATFICKFCEQTKPISEMTVIARFFPAVSACKDCGKKLR